MPLKDAEIRTIKPGERPLKLFDGHGLFLLVQPTGSKLWRLKYRWQGKERLLSLGPYPSLTLAAAREERAEALRCLREGIDPSVRKSVRGQKGDTLRAIATRWHAGRKGDWTADFAADVWRSLELHVFPTLGDRPIAAITPLELLSVLNPLVAKGSRKETVRRIRQRLSEICRLAILEGLRPDDPASVLVDALPPPKSTPMRAIREQQVGDFLAAVTRAGNLLVTAAIRVQLLTAVRPGEVREARWAEFDLQRAEWTIPAGRMKRRREHVVPLSRQALAVLKDLRALTGHREFLFPHRLDASRPFSDNTVNALIDRVGWSGALTAHGLRSLFSTVSNERQFAAPDVIEHALAHVERSRTKRAYDRGDRLEARRLLMQRWADHVDGLCAAPPPPAT
jgi:integrase